MRQSKEKPRKAKKSLNISDRLAESLSAVAGLSVEPDADLSRLSTLRIGGPADLLVEVATEEALRTLLAAVKSAGAPFQLLGLGSNVLLPDEGLRGVVARLGGEFKEARIDGARVTVGGAVTLGQIARKTAAAGLSGLEALSGFPSTVGGAVFMNAGCYGTEIKDVLTVARVADDDGNVRELSPDDLEPGYRTTVLQKTGGLVLEATFQLEPGEPEACLATIDDLNRRRKNNLPSGHPNVGSIFRNPPGDYAGRLIDACGLKGETAGGAQISPKHGNVIVNLGGARAGDVLELMVRAFVEVEKSFDARLEPEVVLAGGLRGMWMRMTADAADAGTARV